MIGQFSLFDNVGSLPCQYKFDRYIGQKVTLMVGAFPFHRSVKGKVIGIEPYYTFVKTKEGLMVGTPYSLSERKTGNDS